MLGVKADEKRVKKFKEALENDKELQKELQKCLVDNFNTYTKTRQNLVKDLDIFRKRMNKAYPDFKPVSDNGKPMKDIKEFAEEIKNHIGRNGSDTNNKDADWLRFKGNNDESFTLFKTPPYREEEWYSEDDYYKQEGTHVEIHESSKIRAVMEKEFETTIVKKYKNIFKFSGDIAGFNGYLTFNEHKLSCGLGAFIIKFPASLKTKLVNLIKQ